MDPRAALDAEDLLKIVLVLVVIWVAVEILEELLSLLLGPVVPLIGLLVVTVIVLWFLDLV